MANLIDTNIVKMVFDNSKFNKNVEESAKTLDSLKSTFSNVEQFATKAGFHIQDVWQKMSSYFEYNIARKLVNSITGLTKSMSVDQVTAGWDKFQEKTVAVQTIMSATGKSIDEVNKQLDKLVWFSDETSYSFTDMTSNIGKFTAAGVDLQKASDAMQGIATWAALSGQDAGAASRAMYNLSQSIGMGYMTTMDWKSIENANMATIEFKQNVIDVAKELGTIKEVGKDKNGKSLFQAVVDGVTKGDAFNAEGLRNELSQGWMTNDVILKTLNMYGGFATKLQEATKKTGLTATDLLQAIKAFQNGEDLSEYLEASTVSSEEFDKILKELNSDTYALGRKAFKAAQECKTFKDVIDATKDAVSTKWMETFNYIFGDLDDAKEFWTEMVDDFYTLFAEAGDTRNRIMKAWSQLGGRQDFLDSYRNIMDNIINIIDVVKKAFNDIFPKMTGKKLKNITELIKNFTEKILLSEETLDKLRRTLKGVFAIVDIAFTIVNRVISGILKPLLSSFGKTSSSILDVSASFGDWLAKIDKSLKENTALTKIINGLGVALAFLAKAALSPIQLLQKSIPYIVKIKNVLGSFVKNVFGDIVIFCKKATKAIKDFINSFELLPILIKVLNVVKTLLFKVLEGVKEILAALANVIKNFSLQAGAKNLAKFGFFAWLLKSFNTLKKVKNVVKNVCFDLVEQATSIKDALFGIADAVGGALATLSESLMSWTKKNNMDYIKTVAVTVAILAGSLFILSQLDAKQLAIGLSGVSALLGEVYLFMYNMNNLSVDTINAFNIKKLSKALVKVALAIAVLSYSVKMLSGLSVSGLVKGLAGVTALMYILFKFMDSLNKNLDPRKFVLTKKAAKALILLAAAIYVLSLSVKKLGELPLKNLITGLSGVAILGGLLVGFCQAVNNIQIKKGTGLQLILVSAAIAILSGVTKSLGKMSVKDMIKGLSGVVVLSTVLAGLSRALDGVKINARTAIGLVILSGVIAILVSMAKKLGEMKIADMIKGLSGLIVISGLLVGLSAALSYLKIGFGNSMTLLIIASTIAILSGIAKSLGSMNLSSLAKGLGALVIISGTLVAFAASIKSIKFNPKDASAIIIMSAAIGVLALSMKIISSIPTDSLVQSVIAMSVALGVLVGVAYLVKAGDLSLSLMKFAGSVAVLGASFIALGIGTTLLGIGLTSVAVGIYALAKALVAIGDMIDDVVKALIRAIKDFIVGIIDLIPSIVDAIFKIFTSIADNIGNVIGSIYKIIKEVLKVVIDAFTTVIPDLVVAIIKFIDVALVALREHLPSILNSILKIIISIIEGLGENSVEIIGALFHLIESIFKGFAEAFKNFDSSELKDGIKGMLLFAEMATAIAVAGALVPAAIVGALELVALAKVLTTVFKAFAIMNQEENIEWFMSEGAKFLQMFGTAIGKFIGGLIGGIASGITSNLPDIANDLSIFMYNLQPFIEMSSGLSGIDFDSFGKLTSGLLLLTGAELLDSVSKWINKDASFEALGKDLSDFGEAIKPFLEMAPMFNGLDLSGLGQIGELILKLTGAKILEGLTSWFTGEHSFAEFGESLSAFAASLVNFGVFARMTDTEAIEKVLPVIDKLIELEDNLANHGGVAGFFAGDNDFSAFGKNLVDLGEGVSKFANSVSSIESFDNVDESIDAIGKLIELENSLANHGGVAGFFAGDNDFSKFGVNLGYLGEGLQKYSGYVSDLALGMIGLSLDPLEKLIALDSNLTDHGGVVGWWNGDTDLSDFGDSLEDLGEGLSEYHDEIKNITQDQYKNMISSISVLRGLAKIDKEYSDTFKDDDFEYFEDFCENVGEGLYELYEKITKIKSWHSIQTSEKSTKILAKSMKALKDYKKVDITGFSKEATEIGKGLYNFYAEAKKVYSFGTVTSAIKPAQGLADIVKKFVNYKKVSATGLDTAMTNIGKGLYNYYSEVKNIPDASSMNLLAESVVPAQNLSSIVSSFLDYSNVDVTGLDTCIGKIGSGLRAYWDALQGDGKGKTLDNSGMLTIISSVSAVESLTDIIKAFQNGELSIANSNLLGVKDSMKYLGEGLKSYWTNTKDFDDGKITTMKNSADVLLSLNNVVSCLRAWPTTNKKKGEAYATACAQLATGLTNFYDVIQWYTNGWTGKVSAALPIASTMVGTMTDLEDVSSETIKKFDSNFSTACGNLGIGLSEFYIGAHLDEIDLNTTTLDKSLESVKKLVAFLCSDDAKGTFTGWTFEGLGTQLYNLGYGLFQFWAATHSVGTINWDGVKLADATGKLVKVIKDNYKDVKEVGTTDFSGFFGCCSSISAGMSAFISSIKDVDSETLTSAITNLKSLKTFITKDPVTEDDVINTSKFRNAFSDLASLSIDKFVEIFSDDKKAKNAVGEWVTAIKTAMTSETNKIKIKEAAKTLADTGSKALQSSNVYLAFKNAGAYAGQGFAEGLSGKVDEAKKAVNNLGTTSSKTLKNNLREKSPSRVFKEIGAYATEGFVVGLKSYLKDVENTSVDIGDTATNSISSAIARASALITDGMDADPTIRPVMDLSDIESGVYEMSNLMSGMDSMTIKAQSVSRSMNMRSANQNDEVERLNQLYNKLSATENGNTTYENTFNISGDNPKAIANEVSKIINSQSKRRSAAWGI